ncbi:MAG: MbnP family protein [Bacteroidota bacterium]
MKLLSCFFIVACLFLSFTIQSKKKPAKNIKIYFANTVAGERLLLGKSYTNPFKEKYTISRLKYYITNVSFKTTQNKVIYEKDSYHLIAETEEGMEVDQTEFSLSLKPGTYQSISFLIGVDSIKNVSGAQTNALDPLNGMFWAWNTGYIMFKLEGNSPQSKSLDNKVEYHIGGFKGVNNVLRRVELDLQPQVIKKGNNTEIVIKADIDKLWKQGKNIRITEIPVCTTEGTDAVKIADNYSKIFSIHSISTHKN